MSNNTIKLDADDLAGILDALTALSTIVARLDRRDSYTTWHTAAIIGHAEELRCKFGLPETAA